MIAASAIPIAFSNVLTVFQPGWYIINNFKNNKTLSSPKMMGYMLLIV